MVKASSSHIISFYEENNVPCIDLLNAHNAFSSLLGVPGVGRLFPRLRSRGIIVVCLTTIFSNAQDARGMYVHSKMGQSFS
ncbi:hypothetical protein KC19_2G001900 [Ceratodon purpureus]|uniref:Uncharacterized protein n=1 Tax=Ceratodon purpureus TaxID=3225 RepID=A0A8T0IQI1_CERPU|nr:hypothetical protein KC19_2G001900 [Ceratodon purpureus]